MQIAVILYHFGTNYKKKNLYMFSRGAICFVDIFNLKQVDSSDATVNRDGLL